MQDLRSQGKLIVPKKKVWDRLGRLRRMGKRSIRKLFLALMLLQNSLLLIFLYSLFGYNFIVVVVQRKFGMIITT